MACKCGTDYRIIDGILQCPNCGRIATHQPNERELLLTERAELVNIIKDFIDLLEHEDHKLIQVAKQKIANLYETH